MKTLKRLFAPYMVSALWGGKYHHHFAWTLREAREWMACYPASTRVGIFRGDDYLIRETR